MSKRSDFVYNGSKIEIVPSVPSCDPPAKKPKLSTKIPQEPKVITNIDTTTQNAEISQSQKHSKDCEKIPVVIQERIIPSSSTAKKSSVSQAINKNNYSQKNVIKAEASCSSWASNYLSSIGDIYKKPTKLNLSTSKSPKANLFVPVQKVNSLDNRKKAFNINGNYSANHTAICRANLKVLVNAEEAPVKLSKTFNSDNTLITNNSDINLLQHTEPVKNTIDKHTKNSDLEKISPPKKDRDISTSKSYSYKSLSSKPSDKVKEIGLDAYKNRDLEYKLISTGNGNGCENIDTKPIKSPFNKNTSLFKKKHHTSEERCENKTKNIYSKAKDTHCKSPCKFRNETIENNSGSNRNKSKSEKETPSHQTSKRISETKFDRRSSSQCHKRSTSKCIETSSNDIRVDNSLFHYKKPDKNDLVKSTIKSKVVKREYPSRSHELSKQYDKLAQSAKYKSEHKRVVKSVLSSPLKIKTKISSEQTTKNKVRSYCTSKPKIAKEIKQNEITDLRQKLSHKNLNELFSRKQNQNSSQEKHDNLKITIPNTQENKKAESDSDGQLELSTNVKISSPKSKKNKTIKLVINVKYQLSPTAGAKSSDLSGSDVDESDNSNNIDLSFLDEINIDEIVDCLKDCENNCELSKSDVEIIVSSTDESSLDSTLSLHTQESTVNDNIFESILDNTYMPDERLRSISETQNVVSQNKTFSLQLDGIKPEPIETENAGGFGKTLNTEIRKYKIGDNTKAEENRTHQSQTEICFAVMKQDDNVLSGEEIKTETMEIEYGNLSQEVVIDVDSIKEEQPDELQVKLAAFTSQPIRRCTRKETTHESKENKLQNESITLSTNSVFAIQTESDLNYIRNTKEISLINQINIKSRTDKTKYNEENNNMRQIPSSNETRINAELLAGATCVPSSNNSELENTLFLECHSNFKEIKQSESGDVPETNQINKKVLSISDVIFNNADEIKPQSALNAKEINADTAQMKTIIDSNMLKSKSRFTRVSLGTENINLPDKKKHIETRVNKSITAAKTQKIGNLISVEHKKAETNVKIQENNSVILEVASNSDTTISGFINHQELNTDLQFTVVNEMSRKLLATDKESNKKTHSEDTKTIGVKSGVSSKLPLPVKLPETATDNEAESAIKEISNETITKSIDDVKQKIENKPIIVKSQNEESHKRNDVNSSERGKLRSHSPIKSPKCDKSNANNTTEAASPENDMNGTLQGVDEVRGRQLEQRMSEYFRNEYKVLSVINKGHYSIIYKCKDSFGRDRAAKVIKDQHKKYIFGLAKEQMLKQFQKDIPRCKLNFVYIIDGFPIQSRWCLLMEYYPKNLKQVLDEGNVPFNIDEVQNLSKQLISAVTVLRNYNIVHSDIKPAHIMMNSANNKLKLCGFDRAVPINSQILLPTIGTVNYRAPEVILGHSAGYSIDVWSTALVMYEMATKIILFPGLDNNDILFKQMCTLGTIPFDMIYNSLYKDEHFINGVRFMRKLGEHGQIIKYKDQFYKSRRIECTIRSTYCKYWAANRADEKDKDMAKLQCFYKLLMEMLVLHPNHRIPIEFVHANPMIYS